MEQLKDHRIWWDEKYKVVRALGVGVADEETATWMLAETEEMAVEHGTDWIGW